MSEYIKKAGRLYHAGLFPQAREQYLLALEKEPENAQTLLSLGLLALWDNHADQAIDYLQRAYEHSGWLNRRWPFSAQIAHRMAAACYRKDDFANAVKWYKKAVGSWAFGPLQTLKALLSQLEIFGDSQPYQISGPALTEIPFIMLDPLPVVEVRINGQGPYAFFIDTGGGEVIIHSDLARALGCEECASFVGLFAANKPGRIGLSRIDNLVVGNFTISNLPINIHTLEGTEEIFKRKVHGVIGTTLLRHFYSSIDYAN